MENNVQFMPRSRHYNRPTNKIKLENGIRQGAGVWGACGWSGSGT